MQVSYPNEFTASHGLWHRTLEAVGVATNDTHLAGSNLGCWTSVVSVNPRSATRSYAATAYYMPNAGRKNLLVLTGAEVLEILLEKPDGQSEAEWEAKGVRFNHSGRCYSSFVDREVILCAGSVQSPQILELSGIGDPKILSKAEIPVKVASYNVGENLQDHLSSYIIYTMPLVPYYEED